MFLFSLGQVAMSRETRAIDARNNSRSGAVRRSVAVTLRVSVAQSPLLCLLRDSVAGRSARHLTADSGAGCALRAAWLHWPLTSISDRSRTVST
jgi:hypothetical protein